MRIINFNSTKNMWAAWKKTYINDLNIKITSLWNYLVYKNPPYIILNSITSDDPMNLEKEGYCIEVKDSNLKSVNIFFPTHLQLHQGFYNDSNYGDALLGYWDNDTIRPISFGTFTPFVYSSDTTVNIESYDFPSGYCCISNVLPSGENTPDNSKKRNINNYLMYPLGSGSFFTFNAYEDNMIAKYYRNDTKNFVNQVVINLCSSLRYCNKTENKKLNSSGFWSQINYYPTLKQPYIADTDGNIWIGNEDIVPEIYNDSNELIICDSSHQIIENAESKVLLYRLLINTNVTSKNARVELY